MLSKDIYVATHSRGQCGFQWHSCSGRVQSDSFCRLDIRGDLLENEFVGKMFDCERNCAVLDIFRSKQGSLQMDLADCWVFTHTHTHTNARWTFKSAVKCNLRPAVNADQLWSVTEISVCQLRLEQLLPVSCKRAKLVNLILSARPLTLLIFDL